MPRSRGVYAVEYGPPPYAFAQPVKCALLQTPQGIPPWELVPPRARLQASVWGRGKLVRPPTSLSEGFLQRDLSPQQFGRVARRQVWDYGALVGDEGDYRAQCDQVIAALPADHPLRRAERLELPGARDEERPRPLNVFHHYYRDKRHASLYMQLASLGPLVDGLEFVATYGLPRHRHDEGHFLPYPLLVLAHDVSKMVYLTHLSQTILAADEEGARLAIMELCALEAWEFYPESWYDSDPGLPTVGCRVVEGGRLTWEDAVYVLEAEVQDYTRTLGLFMDPVLHADGQRVASIEPIYVTDTLISACYLMFYWDITASAEVRTCRSKTCGAFFYATRPDRKYCSPDCRNRVNVQQHYWRHKNDKGEKEQAPSRGAKKAKPKKKRTSRRTSRPSR